MSLHGYASRTIASVVIGLILSHTGLALRFIARWEGKLKPTVDDYLILLAMIPYWGLAIGGILMTKNGLGQPLTDITPGRLTIFHKIQFAESYLYIFTVAFAKLSVLAMYWRNFASVWSRRNVYACSSLVLAWLVAAFITNTVGCSPIQKIWNPEVAGTCIDQSAFDYGTQIPNILLNVYVIAIPLHKIFALDLTTLQKRILMGILGIAALTIIFDILRLVAMVNMHTSHEDITISTVDLTVWTIIAPGVGIFAACLPTLRPLLRQKSNVENFPEDDKPRDNDYDDQEPKVEDEEPAALNAAQEPKVEDEELVTLDESNPVSSSTDDILAKDRLSVSVEPKGGAMCSSRSISSLG